MIKTFITILCFLMLIPAFPFLFAIQGFADGVVNAYKVLHDPRKALSTLYRQLWIRKS